MELAMLYLVLLVLMMPIVLMKMVQGSLDVLAGAVVGVVEMVMMEEFTDMIMMILILDLQQLQQVRVSFDHRAKKPQAKLATQKGHSPLHTKDYNTKFLKM